MMLEGGVPEAPLDMPSLESCMKVAKRHKLSDDAHLQAPSCLSQTQQPPSVVLSALVLPIIQEGIACEPTHHQSSARPLQRGCEVGARQSMISGKKGCGTGQKRLAHLALPQTCSQELHNLCT